MSKIYKTKTGQPYILLSSGKAKFIKRTSINRRRTSTKARGKNTMARKKHYSRKSNPMGFLGKINKPFMGAAGVVAYESFISPMIPLQGTAKDILELVGGLYLSKKGGILGATGQSLVVLNAYQILSGLVGTKLVGLVGGNTTSAYSYA